MTQYFKNIFQAVASIPASMAVSWKTFTEKPVTLEYPDQRWQLPERARAQLHNNVDDCIGCNKCANVCPVDCIHIQTMKAGPDEDLGMTSKDTPKRLHVLVFDIDMAKCCYCNLCTYPCPTECLTMTPNYEASTFGRYDLVYHFGAYSADEAKALVDKAKERDGAKFRINAVPVKLKPMFEDKVGTKATEPNVKTFAGRVKKAPKPAAAGAKAPTVAPGAKPAAKPAAPAAKAAPGAAPAKPAAPAPKAPPADAKPAPPKSADAPAAPAKKDPPASPGADKKGDA